MPCFHQQNSNCGLVKICCTVNVYLVPSVIELTLLERAYILSERLSMARPSRAQHSCSHLNKHMSSEISNAKQAEMRFLFLNPRCALHLLRLILPSHSTNIKTYKYYTTYYTFHPFYLVYFKENKILFT